MFLDEGFIPVRVLDCRVSHIGSRIYSQLIWPPVHARGIFRYAVSHPTLPLEPLSYMESSKNPLPLLIRGWKPAPSEPKANIYTDKSAWYPILATEWSLGEIVDFDVKIPLHQLEENIHILKNTVY